MIAQRVKKFHRGQRVKLTEEGIKHFLPLYPSDPRHKKYNENTRGTVKCCKDNNVTVRRDGIKTFSTYSSYFWEDAGEDAAVCDFLKSSYT